MFTKEEIEDIVKRVKSNLEEFLCISSDLVNKEKEREVFMVSNDGKIKICRTSLNLIGNIIRIDIKEENVYPNFNSIMGYTNIEN